MTVQSGHTTSPTDVVRRYLDEALAGGDLVVLRELVANDEFRKRVIGFRRAFPDLSVSTEILISGGDLVAVRLQGRGTHRGIFQGVPLTGRAWSAGCSAFYLVQDGRITDCWVAWDLLAIHEQIGGVTRVATASA